MTESSLSHSSSNTVACTSSTSRIDVRQYRTDGVASFSHGLYSGFESCQPGPLHFVHEAVLCKEPALEKMDQSERLHYKYSNGEMKAAITIVTRICAEVVPEKTLERISFKASRQKIDLQHRTWTHTSRYLT